MLNKIKYFTSFLLVSGFIFASASISADSKVGGGTLGQHSSINPRKFKFTSPWCNEASLKLFEAREAIQEAIRNRYTSDLDEVLRTTRKIINDLVASIPSKKKPPSKKKQEPALPDSEILHRYLKEAKHIGDELELSLVPGERRSNISQIIFYEKYLLLLIDLTSQYIENDSYGDWSMYRWNRPHSGEHILRNYELELIHVVQKTFVELTRSFTSNYNSVEVAVASQYNVNPHDLFRLVDYNYSDLGIRVLPLYNPNAYLIIMEHLAGLSAEVIGDNAYSVAFHQVTKALEYVSRKLKDFNNDSEYVRGKKFKYFAKTVENVSILSCAISVELAVLYEESRRNRHIYKNHCQQCIYQGSQILQYCNPCRTKHGSHGGGYGHGPSNGHGGGYHGGHGVHSNKPSCGCGQCNQTPKCVKPHVKGCQCGTCLGHYKQKSGCGNSLCTQCGHN